MVRDVLRQFVVPEEDDALASDERVEQQDNRGRQRALRV